MLYVRIASTTFTEILSRVKVEVEFLEVSIKYIS